MNKFSIPALMLFGATCLTSVAQQKFHTVAISPNDTPDEIVRKAANVVPTARQFKWQEKELTAFLHFGVNTFTNREWGDGKESPSVFNPTKLNAQQWIETLKEAGFKQVILTCKHHDGFCLWPSAQTQHSVKNSPWKNGQGDVVKEVADACHRLGVGFGVYLSPWDRNASCYGTPEYNDFFVKQLTELLTNYGKVEEVWFDGACGEGPNGKKQEYDFVRYYQLIRQLQPEAVIAVMGPDVRWVGTESGRGREMEWSVVPNNQLDQESIANNSQKEVITKPVGDMRQQDLGSRSVIQKAKTLVWYPAEVDVSIRPGWFYHETQDKNVKSAKELMNIYFTSVGMNGVLLLNIPPNTEGLFSEADVKSLKDFRRYMDLTFSNNLMKGAKVTADKGRKPQRIADGKYNTYFTTPNETETVTLNVDLKGVKRFNVLMLQEDVRVGQRVEKFRLEAQQADGSWQTITEGTTIGYKRLLQFKPITAQRVRLQILGSRLNPALAEMGLFFMPDSLPTQ